MKRTLHFLFAAILLMAAGNAWAAEYTHTFAKSDLSKTAGTVTLSGVSWTQTSATYAQFANSTKGFQIGSSKDPTKSFTLSTSGISGTITSVKVNSSIASEGKASFAISVGGTSFSCGSSTSISPTTSAADYDFTGSGTGEVKIVFTNTAKAFYIKSITITYTSSTTATSTVLSSTSETINVGETATLEATVQDYQGSKISDAAVTWTSSDNGVATVDENGVVTAVSAGTATITATYAGVEGTYDASSATCEVKVVDKSAITGEIEFDDETDSFDKVGGSYKSTETSAQLLAKNGNYYTFTHKYCMATSTNELQMKASSGTLTSSAWDGPYIVTVTYSSNAEMTLTSGELSATGSNGVVTLTVADGSAFTLTTGSKYAIVSDILIQYTGKTSGIAWSADACTADLAEGASNTYPTLSNPNNVAVTYASSDESVAKIDAEGNITLVGTGSCTISATSEATDDYSKTTAKYTLTVKNSDALEATYDFTQSSEDYGSGCTQGGSNEFKTTDWYDLVGGSYLEFNGGQVWNSSGYMVMTNGCILAIDARPGYVLTGVTITFTESSYSNLAQTIGEGYSASGTTGTWTGYTKEIAFEDDGEASRIKTITVTYAKDLNYQTVVVTPNPMMLRLGQTQKAEATVYDVNENDISSNSTVTWSIADEKIATIASDGTVTPVSVGTTTITATVGNYKGTAELNVVHKGTIVFSWNYNSWKNLEEDTYTYGDTYDTEGTVGFTAENEQTYPFTVYYVDRIDMPRAARSENIYYNTLQFKKKQGYIVSPKWNFSYTVKVYYHAQGNNTKLTLTDVDDESNTATESEAGVGCRVATMVMTKLSSFKIAETGGNAARVYRIELIPTEDYEEFNAGFPITIGTTAYGTLYYGVCALTVPDGVQAQTYYVDDEGTLIIGRTYSSDSKEGYTVIPAGEAVVLYDNDTENKNTYFFYVANAPEYEADANNQLLGFDYDAQTVSKEGTTDGYYFYKLTTYGGKDVGFYWGAAGGALPFTSKAHKAYLCLDKMFKDYKTDDEEGTSAKSFLLADAVTGIATVTATSDLSRQGIYTLSGIRLSDDAQTLKPGLYIINGKKVLVK